MYNVIVVCILAAVAGAVDGIGVRVAHDYVRYSTILLTLSRSTGSVLSPPVHPPVMPRVNSMRSSGAPAQRMLATAVGASSRIRPPPTSG